MIIKIIDKSIREIYRLFHPMIWNKKLQINGIPRIYDIRKLTIDENVSINPGIVLQCYGGLKIGNNVTISDGAKVFTRSLDINKYLTNSTKEKRDHIDQSVEIGDGVWIAANVIVLPGVRIASRSIIAAGAVVSQDLNEEGCLYGGIPAKMIRKLQ